MDENQNVEDEKIKQKNLFSKVILMIIQIQKMLMLIEEVQKKLILLKIMLGSRKEFLKINEDK